MCTRETVRHFCLREGGFGSIRSFNNENSISVVGQIRLGGTFLYRCHPKESVDRDVANDNAIINHDRLPKKRGARKKDVNQKS